MWINLEKYFLEILLVLNTAFWIFVCLSKSNWGHLVIDLTWVYCFIIG